MYQVIARKYRPQTFRGRVSQEHVKTTLENAIAQNRIAHGYIFSGQRGTGKTTVARILARCLNCVKGPTVTPCGVCASCLEIAAGRRMDVIEIDAASNRGINEMRELRENVRYPPGARPLQSLHRRRSAPDHQRSLQRAAEDARRAAGVGRVHPLHHRGAQDSRHHRLALPAVQLPVGGFRGTDRRAWTGSASRKASRPTPKRWPCWRRRAKAACAIRSRRSIRPSPAADRNSNAAEVRGLLGMFSLESLENVAAALPQGDSRRMLEVVDELERNGHNLQHFCRELARYFRNLLVARIAGSDTRLLAASPAQRERLAATAAQFSEEDLTRYLQLTLELFQDLQQSLQPRFHLEVGLVRLVQAGKLLPIEEALAGLGSGAKASAPAPVRASALPPPAPVIPAAPPKPRGPSPFERDRARKSSERPPEPQSSGANALAPEAAAPQPVAISDWRQKLHAALTELGMTFTADAVENSIVTESGGELQFVTSAPYKLALQPEDLQKGIRHLGARPMRIKVTVGTSEPAAAVPIATPKRPSAQEDEAAGRALANPEVQRFRDVFGGEVRKIRNLKE